MLKSDLVQTDKHSLNYSALKVQRFVLLGTESPLTYSNIKLEFSDSSFL